MSFVFGRCFVVWFLVSFLVFRIILVREKAALLKLCWAVCVKLCLFLTVSYENVGLFVVCEYTFPCHTHLLFKITILNAHRDTLDV